MPKKNKGKIEKESENVKPVKNKKTQTDEIPAVE